MLVLTALTGGPSAVPAGTVVGGGGGGRVGMRTGCVADADVYGDAAAEPAAATPYDDDDDDNGAPPGISGGRKAAGRASPATAALPPAANSAACTLCGLDDDGGDGCACVGGACVGGGAWVAEEDDEEEMGGEEVLPEVVDMSKGEVMAAGRAGTDASLGLRGEIVGVALFLRGCEGEGGGGGGKKKMRRNDEFNFQFLQREGGSSQNKHIVSNLTNPMRGGAIKLPPLLLVGVTKGLSSAGEYSSFLNFQKTIGFEIKIQK